jgi:hypothetical protein
MGVDPVRISSFADEMFTAGFVSDLGNHPIVYPFGLPNLAEIVQPARPGANWRLILYIALAFPEYPTFAERFVKVVVQIQEERMEAQAALVLMKILTERAPEFAGDFGPCIGLITRIVRLVLARDPLVLRPLLKLMKAMNRVKASGACEGGDLAELYREMNRSFRTFGNMQSKKELQRLVASVKGECAALVFGDAEPNEGGAEEESAAGDPANLFSIQETTDDDFRPGEEDDLEREEADP